MHKPLGIFAFTNLVREESEWQSVSESPSTGAYVGFLFACYSTPLMGDVSLDSALTPALAPYHGGGSGG
jgi:hypothetical protein